MRYKILMETAFISIGSNLGNKLENCKNAITSIEKETESKIKAVSDFYKTEPVDYTDQDWFVNGVVKIETPLSPYDLLKKLRSIEKDAGRIEKKIRFGPRVLDLDILLFSDVVINLSDLVIPHPRMYKRCFVLKPLCDIGSEIVHPVFKKDMKKLLQEIDDTDQRVIKI